MMDQENDDRAGGVLAMTAKGDDGRARDDDRAEGLMTELRDDYRTDGTMTNQENDDRAGRGGDDRTGGR